MATGTCSSKTLASCESGNGIKACRHGDAKIGQTEPHAKTVDKKPKEVKKLKKVKFAVERVETMMQRSRTYLMMRLQRSRTSRRMQNCDGCILWSEASSKWSRVDNGQDEEPAGIIEPSGVFVVVVGTSQCERRIRITS